MFCDKLKKFKVFPLDRIDIRKYYVRIVED